MCVSAPGVFAMILGLRKYSLNHRFVKYTVCVMRIIYIIIDLSFSDATHESSV